jgi:hypothetical protein
METRGQPSGRCRREARGPVVNRAILPAISALKSLPVNTDVCKEFSF